MSKIEYCPDCLQKACKEHMWFGMPTTEKEVLRVILKDFSDLIPSLIEKVYLVETVLHEPEDRFFTNGKINFGITTEAAHKKKDYYIPLNSYDINEKGVINYTIEVTALITRHNPICLTIRGGLLGNTLLHSVELIRETDFLHCEEISHYNKILIMAKKRLADFIATIEDPV